MEALDKYFDHYVINARLKPTFFVVMPFAVTTLAWCPEAQQLAGVMLTFLITFGVMAFLSNLVSSKGNRLQGRLFRKWGGAPTTLLLRYSDPVLDGYTTQRYHRWLEAHIPGLKMPGSDTEASDSSRADGIYVSATNYLREKTRDKSKYPMVYADNVAYGFARNLLAMRRYGVSIALLSVAMNVAFVYLAYDGPSFIPYARENISMVILGLGAAGVSVVFLFIFLFSLNEGYVRDRAFRYGKSLLAVCEGLA